LEPKKVNAMTETTLTDPASSIPIKPGLVRLFFPGFLNTDWSEAYLRAVDKVARDIRIERESAMDHFTIVHVTIMSILHSEAQSRVAERFLSALRDEIVGAFDLKLDLKFIEAGAREIVAEYDFAQSKTDVIEHVRLALGRGEGEIPPDVVHHDAQLITWLVICFNARRAKSLGKRADVYADILEKFEREEIICSLLKRSLDQVKLIALLERPLDTIAASRPWAHPLYS
jgi:hypothetical protein